MRRPFFTFRRLMSNMLREHPAAAAVVTPVFPPLIEGMRVESSVLHSAGTTGGKARRRALVLDDSRTTNEKLKKVLERQGFEVSSAKTVEEATREYSAAKKEGRGFSAVVSDLDLTGRALAVRGKLGGYGFVQWVAEQGDCEGIVLHSTAFDNILLRVLLNRIKKKAERKGITVQGKRQTLKEGIIIPP
jgi:hypothetical protein